MIMMVCLLAYLAGWTAVPRMVQAPAQTTVDCCAKIDKTTPHKCPKEGKGEKRCADCCISCPLCYTMILPAAAPEGPFTLIVKQVYADWQSADIFGYHSDTWKPPNQA